MVGGNTVALACVGYGSPNPNITWSRDGSILSNDTRITIYGELVTEGDVTFVQSILKICNANVSDGGPYICLATNLHGNDNATFDLTVNPVSGNLSNLFQFVKESLNVKGVHKLNIFSFLCRVTTDCYYF